MAKLDPLDHNLTMRSTSKLDGQDRAPSFIEAARRKQIVDTTIRTIASKGYKQTSLAEIAKEAGISKGVISYHFAGKDALIDEILARLLHEPAVYIKERVDAKERAIDKLQAYVSANFEFMHNHRDNYVALVDLWGGRLSTGEANTFNADAYEPSRKYLTRILDFGQESGAFRPLSSRTLASVIQGAIDGVMLQWVFEKDAVDLEASSEEIKQMISHHVR